MSKLFADCNNLAFTLSRGTTFPEFALLSSKFRSTWPIPRDILLSPPRRNFPVKWYVLQTTLKRLTKHEYRDKHINQITLHVIYPLSFLRYPRNFLRIYIYIRFVNFDVDIHSKFTFRFVSVKREQSIAFSFPESVVTNRRCTLLRAQRRRTTSREYLNALILYPLWARRDCEWELFVQKQY